MLRVLSMKYKLLLFIGIAFNVFAQYLLKYGMNQIGIVSIGFKSSTGFKQIFLNPFFYLSLVCYGFGFLLYAIVLSRLELNRVFPVASVFSIVFIYLISLAFLNETITVNKVIGVIFCSLAIYFMYR